MTVEILHGDCIEKMSHFLSDSVDVVVTSPPYNIGIDYASYEDNLGDGDYHTWLRSVFIEIHRLLKPEGSFFLNVGSTSKNPWLSYDVAQTCRDFFVLQNRIVWAKSISIGEATHGHFKPVNSKRFLNNTYEELYHFTKTGHVELQRKAIGVPYMDKANIGRFSQQGDVHCRGNIWHIPYKTVTSKSEKSNHPAIFPNELVTACLKLVDAGPGTHVLDPFAGTGTTLIAAKDLGCDATGIELDGGYVKVIKERVK